MMCNDMEGLYDSINNNSNMTSNLSSSEIYSDAEASMRQNIASRSNRLTLKAPRVNPSDRLHNYELSHFGFSSKENE